MQRAKDVLIEFKLKEVEITTDVFDRYFKSKGGESFISFAKIELEKRKGIYMGLTYKKIKSCLNKLENYKPNLTFSEIDLSFLLKYETYLREKKANKTNTVGKDMRFIRTYWNIARKQGLVSNYPFEHYSIKTEDTARETLTFAELEKLNGLLTDLNVSVSQRYHTKIFLFCCYTGLRHQDIQQLRFSDIKDGFISLKMQKTKDVLFIPLIDKAKKLIPDGLDPADKVFRVPANQTCNSMLKDIMALAKINKSISFHCARHSFAVNSLELGIPLEVVQKLLGHRSIKTTQIYGKIRNRLLENEMQKWN